MPRLPIAALLLAFAGTPALAQSPAAAVAAPATAPTTKPLPFEKEILAFEAADAKRMPAPGGILFVGSSSVRLWKTLAEDFPGLPVINRGFGGSTMPDSTRYASRIVVPYKPKTILIYAGDNDLQSGHTPEKLFENYKEFVATVRKDLPEARILYLAVKPSPSRWKLADKQRAANALIKAYAEADKSLGFIDVFTPLLGADGKPRAELFKEDMLHMNAEGYKIWTAVVKPYLK